MSRPDLRLDWCSHAAAKYAVEKWHYSHLMPRNKLAKIGVWEDGQFIGAVIYGVGASDALGSPYGLVQTECCELVRVALRAHKSAVSRIVAISLRLLKRVMVGLRLVVSFADPVQGHHGGIYQAGGWLFSGDTEPSDEFVVNGQHYHGRALRKTFEGRRWRHLQGTTLDKARTLDPSACITKGSTKHRYLMPLDDAMRAQIAPLARPYPKRVASILADAPAAQAGEGRAALTATLQEVAG